MFRRGPAIPPGWELAPSIAEQEIFLIWQEEDLPAELKDAPGHVSFTPSAETQAWIDSMIEVRELQAGKERHVVGRPAPRATPQPHRIVRPQPAPYPPASPVASPPSLPARSPSLPSQVEERKPELPAMPEILLGRSLPPARSRRRQVARDEEPLMPEIGSGGRPPRQDPDEEVLMPEIDV